MSEIGFSGPARASRSTLRGLSLRCSEGRLRTWLKPLAAWSSGSVLKRNWKMKTSKQIVIVLSRTTVRPHRSFRPDDVERPQRDWELILFWGVLIVLSLLFWLLVYALFSLIFA